MARNGYAHSAAAEQGGSMTLKLIVGPTDAPVSLQEARTWCRIDDDSAAEDEDLRVLIESALQEAQRLTGRSFMSATWERVLDSFPSAEMELAAGPVHAILSVRYLDSSGDERVMDPDAYVLDDVGDVAFVLPAAGRSWPVAHPGANSVRVRFVQGWSSPSNPRCAPLRQWMRMQIEAGFKVRGALSVGTQVHAVPTRFVDRLLDGYTVY